MTNLNHEMMNIEEVAQYLKMSERAIYDWVKTGKIPAFKLGNTWRFKKSEIDGWMESNRTGPSPNSFPSANPILLTNNVMDEKLQIDEFKKQVQIKFQESIEGVIDYEQFKYEFNEEVRKKGLKELKALGFTLETPKFSNDQFITRR